MKPLRVLYLVNAFELDSPTLLCAEIAGAAIKRGHEVRFAAWSRGGPLINELTQAGIKCITNHRAELYLPLKEFAPDLVHVILARPTISGVPLARRAGVRRVIAGHHGSHEWKEKGIVAGMVAPLLFRVAARKVDRFIAVSGSAASELHAVGIAAEKVSVIPNGVDVNYFQPGPRTDSQIRTALFPDDKASTIQLIGSLGNLRPVKGFADLVNAAPVVLSRHPNARFVIWGEGQLQETLQRQINQLNLGPVFKLAGQSSVVRDCLRACDIYVQPSRRESFGMAAAEAMACGLPVVAAKVGGLPELVNGAGLIYDRGGDKLSDSISQLLGDTGRLRELCVAARVRAVKVFSSSQMITSYLELYDKIVSEKLR